MEFFGGRVGVAMLALTAGANGVVTVVVNTEKSVLNVPLSMLFVAIAGALIGVLILPASDAARVGEGQSIVLWRKLLVMALRAGLLALAILGYAFLAAWTVQLAGGVIKSVSSVTLPLTGILGVFIRPLLPKYMQGVEGITERLLGRFG